MSGNSADMVTLKQCRRVLGPGVEFYCDEFHAEPGDHVALWGPSGCGKSTMLNLVSGLLQADEGLVEVDGADLSTLSQGQRDRFRKVVSTLVLKRRFGFRGRW